MTSPLDLDVEFPSRRTAVQFNHAAICPLPARAAAALLAYARNLTERGGLDWRDWPKKADEVRALAARVVGADERVGGAGSISIVPNTTWGLDIVAQGLDFSPGDSVVTTASEFPANLAPWVALEKKGVSVRRVPTRDGAFTAEDVAAACDETTRLVSVSLVAFHTGFRAPVEEFGALCRSRGIVFGLDAHPGRGRAAREGGGLERGLPVGGRAQVDARARGLRRPFHDSRAARCARPSARLDESQTRARGGLPRPRGAPSTSRTEPGSSRARFRRPASTRSRRRSRFSSRSASPRSSAGSRARSTFSSKASRASASRRCSSADHRARASSRRARRRGRTRATTRSAPPEENVVISAREGFVRFSPHVGNDEAEAERVLALLKRL